MSKEMHGQEPPTRLAPDSLQGRLFVQLSRSATTATSP